ncbi:hypothetical protein SAMN02910358_00919 [Lachnospiraceae bacterium XBB1006]|nr:hypothetical protein SAMN02910358_00919 [Lachnospiraceae bacterium XBB1006]
MKKNHFLLCIGLLCILLSACGYSKEEKALINHYIKQGSKNAKEYIKEKYGFDADVKECEHIYPGSGPVPDFTPMPTGELYVTMSYHHKTFTVAISGKKRTTKGYDDYQHDEIVAAFTDHFQNVTGLLPSEVLLGYGLHPGMSEHNGLVYDYFDGSNLQDVLYPSKNGHSSAVVSLVNKNLAFLSSQVNTLYQALHVTNINVVNYRSAEDMAAVKYRYIPGKPGAWHNVLGLHTSDFLYSAQRDSQYTVIHRTEQDGIILCTFDGAPVSLTPASVDNPEAYNGNGFIKAKQIAQGYQLSTSSDMVLIYYPKAKMDLSSHAEQATLTYQYYTANGNLSHGRLSAISNCTDDDYLTGVFYNNGRSDVRIAAFTDNH